MATQVNIQEIRFLADYKGTLRKICKIKFASGDHSLYLIPYAPQREFFYGQRAFPEQETHDTFDFSEASTRSIREPHLSLHESGRVQVYSGDLPKAGPLFIPTLTTLRGQHVTSVIPDAFESLPVHEGTLRSGARIDHVIPVESGVSSGRLAIYINGHACSFEGKLSAFVIEHTRPTYRGTVYIGIKAIAQLPRGVEAQTGTSILAGWNPELSPDKIVDYLYIRGQ